jgi:hypothetical protein
LKNILFHDNLNVHASQKYRVYEESKNGSLKETWQSNPTCGFVWGFKNWDNYNFIFGDLMG